MEGQRGLDGSGGHQTDTPGSRPVVSSRRRALQRLRAAVEDGRAGPVLITGEPGSGKTWLMRRLVESLPPAWKAVNVDAASAMDALEFLRLIGHSLGVTVPNRLGEARLLLQSTLQDDSTDGRSWILIVDEAHRGSAQIWDEIQTIRNQLGLKTGFVALLVLARTELTRALPTRLFAGFETSLQANLHLRPLDLDEARELLSSQRYDGMGAEYLLEEMHRDASGNPAKLLRLADARASIFSPNRMRASNRELAHGSPTIADPTSTRVSMPNVRAQLPDAIAKPSASQDGNGRMNAPPLIPTRPPIRLEEGLVEVGWEGDLDSEPTRAEETAAQPENPYASSDDSSVTEELVEDRYAALQAWTEWTRNQERVANELSADLAGQTEATLVEEESELAIASSPRSSATSQPSVAAESSVASPLANIRAEPQHDFAPYSQLFTRLRQSH